MSQSSLKYMLTKQENYFYVVVWKEVVQKVEKSTKGPLSETIKCYVLYNINLLSVLYALCISHKLSLSLALLLSFKSATLCSCFWNSTGLLFYVLAAALVHPRPGLLQQSSGSCLSCCSLCTGNWWWLEWLMTEHKHAVEAKYFCAVAVNCRPSYLSFLMRLR